MSSCVPFYIAVINRPPTTAHTKPIFLFANAPEVWFANERRILGRYAAAVYGSRTGLLGRYFGSTKSTTTLTNCGAQLSGLSLALKLQLNCRRYSNILYWGREASGFRLGLSAYFSPNNFLQPTSYHVVHTIVSDAYSQC